MKLVLLNQYAFMFQNRLLLKAFSTDLMKEDGFLMTTIFLADNWVGLANWFPQYKQKPWMPLKHISVPIKLFLIRFLGNMPEI